MAILIMILGGLSVAAMIVTRFDAMTLELAVLRALGYAKKEIAAWLMWEGFILGFIACIIGGTLDFIFLPFIRIMLGSALPGTDIIDISILQSYPIWLIALFATMLSIVIPLLKLYKQDVHSSLRGL